MNVDSYHDIESAQYQTKIDHDAVRQDLIDERAETLLASDFYPFTPINIYESLGDITKADCKQIAELMIKNDFEQLGQFLKEHIEACWQERAIIQAEDELIREEQAEVLEFAELNQQAKDAAYFDQLR